MTLLDVISKIKLLMINYEVLFVVLLHLYTLYIMSMPIVFLLIIVK